MVTIYIHDTGLLTTSSSTALSGAGNVANNGVEIPLKIKSFRFNNGLTFDNTPQPGSFTKPKLAFVSVTAPLITIAGQINKEADVSSDLNVLRKISGGTPTLVDESGTTFTDEVKMLGLLEHASRTKGYKELYYKATTADNVFFGLATDLDIDNATYKCFNVRIKGIDIIESPDSKLIDWRCTLETTT